ncbi:hypothetical protein R0137_09695 [Congregibacter brevis]|uniref:Uncharacterized protein n=1 Tax=Congregibacter brevis TaxID=3081201 RepID=A0ABZ0I7N6_9GAMM|nr:hypothetical protein R0137_09695 [Congregibacter sp. IMCC45268]
MTRQELYDLVWSKPMTHIAKDFGMSDQGVRKHCVKSEIPTPPLGYWAKIAHGKKVPRPKLPTKDLSADAEVRLSPRAEKYRTDSGYDLQKMAEANAELQGLCTVPEELSEKPPAVVKQFRALMRQARTTSNGFKEVGDSYKPKILVGKDSVDRVSRILCTLSTVAESLSHQLVLEDGNLFWLADDERLLLKIKEANGKTPHEPTKAELKEQERREGSDWYSPNRKAYPMWDYFPSGRLSMALSDTVGYGWGRDKIERRWRDTKARTLESRLPEVVLWLEEAVPLVRTKRLEAERQAREEAERQERARQQRERRRMAEELEKAICEMAETNQRRQRVLALAEILQVEQDSDPRLLNEVVAYADVLRMQLCERRLADEAILAGAQSESGGLISALTESLPERCYGW